MAWERDDRFDSVRSFKQSLETALALPSGVAVRESGRGKRRRVIVVVDDESFIRNILCDFFSMEGYHAIPAANLTEARALLSAHPVELIFVPRQANLWVSQSGSGRLPSAWYRAISACS